MDIELKTLINNVEEALWKLQEFCNNLPDEKMPGYIGSIKNKKSLDVYQMRIIFNSKFPHT